MTETREIMFPQAAALELMASGTITDQVTTPRYINGNPGPIITTRLVEGGAGQAGLKDPRDMVEWSGVPNHIFLSTRIAVHYAKKLQEAGLNIDPDAVLNAGIVSHLGRRPWDEAGWYPEAVANWKDTLAVTNEAIGVKMLEEAGMDPKILNVVRGLAHGLANDPKIYESLEYRVFSLVDHLVTEEVHSYEKRMGSIVSGWFMPGITVTAELTEQIQQIITTALQDPAQASMESIHQAFADLGAQEDSSRLTLTRFAELIIEDAHTAKLLKDNGLDISQANEIPEADWEQILRICFLQDSEKAAFADLLNGSDADYNKTKWGYRATRERFQEKAGKPAEPIFTDAEGSPLLGWQTAIYLAHYFAQQIANQASN